MRYDQTYPKTATNLHYDISESPGHTALMEPGLTATAAEALKYIYELSKNLEALEIQLFRGPNKPFPDLDQKAHDVNPGLENQLRMINANIAGLVGFTSSLLNKI